MLHEWDFRGCTTGVAVADTYWPSMALVATPYNDPTCSRTGIKFDGVSQFAQITSYSWGGSTSIEVYVMFGALSGVSKVFDFGSGAQSDNLHLFWSGSVPQLIGNSQLLRILCKF